MVTLPCAWILAHGKVTILTFPVQNFAVCQNGTRQNYLTSPCASGSGTRQRFKLRRVLGSWHTAKIGTSPCVPQILAHGEVGSRRRHPRAVTVPAPAPPSVTLICRVPPLAPDKRHTAKWALPSRLVAVEHSPWAAHGEPICRVLCGLGRVPWAHGKWRNLVYKLVSSCRVYIYC